MGFYCLALVVTSLYCFTLCGEAVNQEQSNDSEEEKLIVDGVFLLSRGESLPSDHLDDPTDHYQEGYIQALVDMNYYEHNVIITVVDHNVYISNLPKNAFIANSIIAYVKDIPGVESVEVREETEEDEIARSKYVEKPCITGIWFPQSTVLFPPFVADPRQVTYSVAYRFCDRVVGKQAAAVSLGDDFPVYRWRNVFRWQGDLQIGIEGCVWAVFNFEHVPHIHHQTSELINTDYYLGIPLDYAFDRLSFRLRIYHISSHLGDEFIVNHPIYLEKRKNPSFEAIDLFTSYQVSRNLRVYFGPGFILHSDETFPMKWGYVEYGFELRFWERRIDYHRLYGTPFIAFHVENWAVRDWNFDFSARIGYEFSKLAGIGRKMRLYADYHHGYSYEGQFFKRRTDYGEVGLSWGW